MCYCSYFPRKGGGGGRRNVAKVQSEAKGEFADFLLNLRRFS